MLLFFSYFRHVIISTLMHLPCVLIIYCAFCTSLDASPLELWSHYTFSSSMTLAPNMYGLIRSYISPSILLYSGTFSLLLELKSPTLLNCITFMILIKKINSYKCSILHTTDLDLHIIPMSMLNMLVIYIFT